MFILKIKFPLYLLFLWSGVLNIFAASNYLENSSFEIEIGNQQAEYWNSY